MALAPDLLEDLKRVATACNVQLDALPCGPHCRDGIYEAGAPKRPCSYCNHTGDSSKG